MASQAVFISSVMRGFAPQRQAARSAVELLRLRPVMAEDFGAKAHSSQVACIDGVRQSEVYVLILGERYGYIAASGKSATEEEFDEARRRGIPVLCFVETGTKEPRQEEFLARLKSYEEGYHLGFYDTPTKLKDSIVQALNDLLGNPEIRLLDASGAKAHLDCHSWGAKKTNHEGTWLGAVILPIRQGFDCVSPIDLGKRAVQDEFLKPAMFGDAALFARQLGISHRETEASLIFEQKDEHRHSLIATLEINCDGTLVFGNAIGRSDRQGYSLVRNFVIDEAEVSADLARYFTYANGFYGGLEEGSLLTSFFFGGSLSGLEHKSFGRIPAVEPSGMGMPMHNFCDPLHLPAQPRKISRAKLADAVAEAGEITHLVGRMFRSAGAYYEG